MSSFRNNKVNPFELDGDGEDDGDNWNDDDEWQEQYAAEDRRLMEAYNNNLSGGNNNKASYYHSDRLSEQRHQYHENYAKGSFSSYHDHHDVLDIGNNIQRHSSQMWKFGVLAIVLVLALYVWNGEDRGEGDGYVSMIDEIPKDDYKLIIIGERHSGTAWLQARLKECFPRANVLSNLQRPGFFFQEEPTEHTQQQDDMIVIHVTLNIYDWLEQMRSSPEYAPNHVGKHKEGHIVPLPWKEFLKKPWTMDRPERDLTLQNTTHARCQLGFQYDQVVSCAEKSPGGTDNPIYELHQDDGTAYESILQLRAAKLRNHQSVQNWKYVKKFLTLPYEHVGKEFKARLLNEIHQFAEWTPACSGDVLPPFRDHTASMTTEFVEYVNRNTDWKAEGLVSYEPWTVTDVRAKGIQTEELKSNIAKVTTSPSSTPTTAQATGRTSDVNDDKKVASKASKAGSSKTHGDSTTDRRPDASDNNSTIHSQGDNNTTSQTTVSDGQKGRAENDNIKDNRDDDNANNIKSNATDNNRLQI